MCATNVPGIAELKKKQEDQGVAQGQPGLNETELKEKKEGGERRKKIELGITAQAYDHRA